MFRKVLIANRGEIACRVAATARRLGIRTVAVYSDADANSRHLAACDEAMRVGPASARDSYLRGDAIIAAAKTTGAQAIHPGYGFLSENADFAQACRHAELVFIGPPPDAMRAMGSKSAAKALMEKAGVPLVPGYHGAQQDAAFLHAQADAIGYPVLIKASAGGGGKGMRIVRAAAEFDDALASCKREAAASFGDERVLIEKYLLQPRHIEIQVFADAHGNCVYLFERDCSVQRRHQKVIEEAPAPGITSERRHAMGSAAVAAARAVGYEGAGTVEFIASQDGGFYFMEMNTRLQVEHPVTEMITGFDLVEWQLRIASGEPLPVTQDQLRMRGHAIEARIYAENPDKGFLPAIGRIAHIALPRAVEFECGTSGEEPAAVRIDSGIRAGDSITPHYDPMIAKLIVWGHDRAQAVARMTAALADTHIVGVSNNVDFVSRLMRNARFAQAQLDTGLIEHEHADLFPEITAPAPTVLAFACAHLLADEARSETADPWSITRGWRLNTAYRRSVSFKVDRFNVDGFSADGTHIQLELEYAKDSAADHYVLHHAGNALPFVLVLARDTRIALQLDDRSLHADVVRHDDELHVFTQGRHRVLSLFDPIAHAGHSEADAGKLTAPMPGKVIAVNVLKGARVQKGAALLVMEAMKMEHTIVAPADGTVDEVFFTAGEQVAEGAVLVGFAQSR